MPHQADIAARHQVFLLRFAGGTRRRVEQQLAQLEDELVRVMGGRRSVQSNRTLQRLVSSVRDVSARHVERVLRQVRRDLADLADQEIDFTVEQLTRLVDPGAKDDILSVAPRSVATAALSSPLQSEVYGGATLAQVFRRWSDDALNQMANTVKLGFVEGKTIQEMVTQIIGTADLSFRDGAMDRLRRSITTIIRTANNHVANQARRAVYVENEDEILGIKVVAVLDSRTSTICRARDGQFFPDPATAEYPPYHPNCRTTTIAILDEDEAEDTSSYQEFLERQPKRFQDEVLGPTKGKLFRNGELTVKQFVDENFTPLTIEELRATHPMAFEEAGL